jgi:hypothetical protein
VGFVYRREKDEKKAGRTAAIHLPSLVSHSTCFVSVLNYPLMFTLSILCTECWCAVLVASEGPS